MIILFNVLLVNLCMCYGLSDMRENRMLSVVSNCAKIYIDDWSCYWCRELMKNKSNSFSDIYTSGETKFHHFFYSVLVNQRTLVFGFRGSVMFDHDAIAALENWLLNFDFVPQSLPWGTTDKKVKVHQGMLESYTEMRDLVFNRVTDIFKLHPQINYVRFLGSSLGGSLSTLALIDLATRDDVPEEFKEIIRKGQFHSATNGCPRIGNEEFYNWALGMYNNSDNFRLTNKKDPVPQLPFRIMGYHHLPTEYFFKDNYIEFRKCDGTGEDPNCQENIWPYIAEDHFTYLGIDVRDGYGPTC